MISKKEITEAEARAARIRREKEKYRQEQAEYFENEKKQQIAKDSVLRAQLEEACKPVIDVISQAVQFKVSDSEHITPDQGHANYMLLSDNIEFQTSDKKNYSLKVSVNEYDSNGTFDTKMKLYKVEKGDNIVVWDLDSIANRSFADMVTVYIMDVIRKHAKGINQKKLYAAVLQGTESLLVAQKGQNIHVPEYTKR